MIGLTSFLPTYVQGVMGSSAIVAGFTLTMMSVGWPLASTFTGYIFLKIGFRTTSIIGGIFLFFGSLFFITMDPTKGPLWAGLGSFIIGIGMGMTATTFVVAIQNHVDWKTRGIATASNMFMRMIGSSLGAALLGGVLNSKLTSYLMENDADFDPSISASSINSVLDSSYSDNINPHTLSILENGLAHSLNSVYWAVFVFALVTLVLTMFLPKTDINNR